MSGLIDADKLKDAVYESFAPYQREWASTINQINKAIDAQPTVEAVPVVHGEWIHVPSSDMATGQAYECSNCKKMRYGSFLPPFCQMCGADMRKKV